MPEYNTATFCGASVRSIQSSLGYNGQKSTLRVGVVEDLDNGDFFLPPLPGAPVWLQIPDSNFRFFGIMQSYNKQAGLDGWPTFSVSAEDPRDILEGAVVLLSSYNGATSMVPNLLNVYGYWENGLGFGGSEINESGMPWYKVKNAIHAMTNSVGTTYGGPLSYRGYRYAVDLTQLPVPPIYYRTGGTEATILSLIQQICEDGVCDFFVELENTFPIPTIKVRVASKRYEPPLGTITYLIEQTTNNGNCIHSEHGLEARHDVTSSFCIGAPVQSIYQMTNPTLITPFWGYRPDDSPITGTGLDFAHSFIANCQEVADIVGDIVYPCTVAELCCALTGNNNAAWMNYMAATRTADYNFMRLGSEIVPANVQGFLQGAPPKQPNDLKALNAQRLLDEAQLILGTLDPIRQERMFNFVRRLATEYMGKQFLVRIPFILIKQIPETNQIVFSEQPTDSGYPSINDPQIPLGLSFLRENNFKTEDGKYTAFCRFPITSQIDLGKLQHQGSSFIFDTNGYIYMKVQVDPKIHFIDPITPCVKVTLPAAIIGPAVDGSGAGLGPLVQFLHGNAIDGNKVKQLANMPGNLPGGTLLQPPPYQPEAFAIPFKSNVLTYGPWFAVGAPGRVQLTIDSSLAPWTYGGFDGMNAAGTARVVNALSDMLYTENGSIEFVGLPAYNLGDVLQGNGPNVTDINLNYGVDRISTTYRFQTYTTRFGVFSKDADRRLQRMARYNLQLRADTRALLEHSLTNTQTGLAAIGAQLDYQWLQFQKKAVKGQSPVGFIVGRAFTDHTVMQMYETSTSELAVAVGYPDNYLITGGMSLDGLFRPFDTNPSGTSILPRYLATPTGLQSKYGLYVGTVKNLNPFQPGNEIELMIRGNGSPSGSGINESDLHNYWIEQSRTDWIEPTAGTRPLALRAPLVLCGYGYDIDCRPIPITGGNDFYLWPYTLKDTAHWATGPTDFLFDNKRGVWTMHDLMLGKLTGDVGGGAFGAMKVIIGQIQEFHGEVNNISDWIFYVYNPFTQPIPSGTIIMAGYFMQNNQWMVVSADCGGLG